MLLVVVFAAVSVYYNLVLSAQSARVTQLQDLTSELESKNSQLERKLSSLDQSGGNTSLFGLNPVDIYDSANRSVVTIQGSKNVLVDTFFGPQQTTESVIGSGFVVDSSSSYYIVTNFHVVEGLVNTTVTFWDGNSYLGKTIGSDPYSDLAVVSVQAAPGDMYPLELSSSTSLKVGMPVVAIGNPFGLSGSITLGIVSQLGRTIQYQSTSATYSLADVIQFSAPVNPGNSGGPLLNANGMVVGITSAEASGSQGVGFAIPSDTIMRELPYIVATGKYDKHPELGLQGVDMSYQLSQAIGTNVTYGVLIEKETSGGPTDRAGLRGGQRVVEIAGQGYLVGGDIIVSINGTRIVNYDAFSTYLERYTVPGEAIQVGIMRSGSFLVVQVIVGARSS